LAAPRLSRVETRNSLIGGLQLTAVSSFVTGHSRSVSRAVIRRLQTPGKICDFAHLPAILAKKCKGSRFLAKECSKSASALFEHSLAKNRLSLHFLAKKSLAKVSNAALFGTLPVPTRQNLPFGRFCPANLRFATDAKSASFG